MNIKQYKKEKNNIFKKYFINYKPIIFIIILLCLIFLVIYKNLILFPLILLSTISIIYVYSYINELITLKKIYQYKNKIKVFNYKPINMNNKEFIEELTNYGLPITFIEINNNIYSLEVGKSKNNYTCYIDAKEFNSLEEFLNYEIENTNLKELKKIKILAYYYQDPNVLKQGK